LSTAPALPLALTMGDPAGISGEITLKAWLALRARAPAPGPAPVFAAIADPDALAAEARRLSLPVPVRAIAGMAEATSLFAGALPVLAELLPVPLIPGRPDPRHGAAIIASVRRAVAEVCAGRAAGLVTNPLAKTTLLGGGIAHAGHTSWLAELAGGGEPVMMLASPALRVVPVTVHVALREVFARLTPALILGTGRIVARALAADFGLAHPRIAVTGLNPHAGESGTLGREEIEIIAPAIAALRAEGIDAQGPFAADSLFHAQARARYDAALCMYHDQALIPIKTIDFAGAVNVTLGLPIVRTSPDHGTAYDIAGKGVADASSLVAALDMAAAMAARRAAAQVAPPRRASAG